MNRTFHLSHSVFMPNSNRRQSVSPPIEPLAGAAHWRAAGLRYYTLGRFFAGRFGGGVRKISVDAGFTCPNVDGTVAVGGCSFCNNRSFSPSRRGPRRDIVGQIQQGMLRLRARYGCDMFLAYFQPATNTYADVDTLRRVYAEALDQPGIVGLAIGTRPDCLPDEVLDLLQELAVHVRLAGTGHPDHSQPIIGLDEPRSPLRDRPGRSSPLPSARL